MEFKKHVSFQAIRLFCPPNEAVQVRLNRLKQIKGIKLLLGDQK